MKRFFSIFIVCFNVIFFSGVSAQEEPTPKKTVTNSQDENPRFSPAFQKELNKGEEEGDTRFFEEFVNMLLYLGGTIAFIVFFIWILKRLLATRVGQVNETSSIKILEHRVLSQKTSVYMLQISGKIVAITDSINGVTLLGEFPDSKK